MTKASINKLTYEVWYASPTSRERRLASFHFRFDAEEYINNQKHKNNYYIKEEN